MSGKGLNLLRNGGSQWAIRNTSQWPSMQLRTFSSSLARLKTRTVPVFKPTSSPELDELLENLRKKVIIPAYLSRFQRQLIFEKKHWKSLEAEPVIAKIGDQEFRLEPIDIMNDRPNYVESTMKALSLMEEKGNYDNLIGLLDGMNRARATTMKMRFHGKIARTLERHGRQDILLECVRQASRTGFILSKDMRHHVLAAMSRKASVDWDAANTEKALRWSEQILDLMEEPIHAPKPGRTTPHPHKDPAVLGRLLEISAMRASKHQGGKDTDGKVEYYAKKVIGSFANVAPVPARPGATETDKKISRRSENSLVNQWLATVVHLLHGMKVAQAVLGPTSEVANQLGEKAAALQTDVDSAYENLSNSPWGKSAPRWGIIAYRECFGEQSQNVQEI